MKRNRLILGLAALILIAGGIVSSGVFGLNWNLVNRYFKVPSVSSSPVTGNEKVKIVSEESVVIEVVKKATPAVVTVSITRPQASRRIFQINPFNPFSPFEFGPAPGGSKQNEPQDIGSGFIVESDGLVITNKHVVSEAAAKYKVVTADNKTFDVEKIYRDPGNDLAILKVNTSGLPTVTLGDSGKVEVGQLAIAIGTALGEFRSTVTTGVVSGVGRGITAGGPFEGAVEQLDGVIQTSAAINPGNSGGPLLNSGAQVIGVNTAVAQDGQNIGFAIPINIIKDALANFKKTGQFNRPFLGIRFKTITKNLAVMNDIPEGAYVAEVVEGSPAARAGIEQGDIITKIGDTRLSGKDNDLAKIVSGKKVGETLNLTLDREGKEINLKVTLGNQSEQ